MNKPHIEVRRKILFHIVIVSSNGQTMLSSEVYFSSSNATRAAVNLAEVLGLELR